MELDLVRINSRWIFPATPAGTQIGLRWRWWETTEREVSKDQDVLGVPVDQPPHAHGVVARVDQVDQVKNSILQQICLFF